MGKARLERSEQSLRRIAGILLLFNEFDLNVFSPPKALLAKRNFKYEGEVQVMWSSVDRDTRSNGHGYERREDQEVELQSYTEICNERCGNAWWRDYPRGTIGEREPAVRGGQ